MNDGSSVVVGGSVVGTSVGTAVGDGDGSSVGSSVMGTSVGEPVGANVVGSTVVGSRVIGSSVGVIVGKCEGGRVGSGVGTSEGCSVGTSVKMITVRFHPVGGIVCTVGGSVGVSEGVPVGCSVGRTVETGNGSDDGGSVLRLGSPVPTCVGEGVGAAVGVSDGGAVTGMFDGTCVKPPKFGSGAGVLGGIGGIVVSVSGTSVTGGGVMMRPPQILPSVWKISWPAGPVCCWKSHVATNLCISTLHCGEHFTGTLSDSAASSAPHIPNS